MELQRSQFKTMVRGRLKTDALQRFAAFVSLILLVCFFSITSEHFLNADNLITVALQTAVIGIIALGQTMVIITGGIDLSVGSIVALSGVVCGKALEAGYPVWMAVVLGCATGLVFGVVNGVLVTKGTLPPFIVTLGTMMIGRGITLVITDSIPISGFDQAFANIAGGKMMGVIPNPVVYFAVLAVFVGYVLSKTTLGRYTYAVGSNEEAARLSGIDTVRTKIMVYSLSGLLTGISGVLLTSRLISAQPTAGYNYEMDSIAAVVIGGASLMGGEGTIVGTIIGAFIMSILKNGLNLLDVSSFWQMVTIGAVVLVAVYIDKVRKR
jgi:ribose transport system permease protein